MNWLVSLAPVLAPLFGMVGVLGGAVLMYRQNKRKNDSDARITKAQVDASKQTADAQTYVEAMKTVTSGFTNLLDQQRSVNAQTLERVSTLESRQIELERKVEHLHEEQRQFRRWKAAAVDYIRDLRDVIRKLTGGPAPAPPRELAADVGNEPESQDAT
ncbi:hypothetical protein [Streptomyces xantholiticus]|uniref:Secreted protein n=1 Tax=Streptomyces xantholiticus TaxID=68285 RepID=A0ABV1UZQ8_9ACTN